jgi:hypothetical protein
MSNPKSSLSKTLTLKLSLSLTHVQSNPKYSPNNKSTKARVRVTVKFRVRVTVLVKFRVRVNFRISV